MSPLAVTLHSGLLFFHQLYDRDCSVRKGPDVRRVIGRRLHMRQDDKFNLLIQEAVRCDKSLVSKCRITESHMSSVFTRLMLQGNEVGCQVVV